jgi:hypothetical protein
VLEVCRLPTQWTVALAGDAGRADQKEHNEPLTDPISAVFQ